MARLLRPKEHKTVSQWARDHLGFDDQVLPWQAEIMDALGDPETGEVGLMGPAQAGKSEIGLAWLGYSIEHDPAGFMICQPDKTLAQDFVVRRVAPLVKNTPVLRAQQLDAVGADNIFLKQFRAMMLTSIWPVAAQFRARPVPRGWLDDFDAIADDIEGQGSALTLMDARATSFEGRDKKFVSSSPARENGGGIEAFVAAGTDERLKPVCPSCGERIELDITRDLKFDARGTADDAEASAHVVCPASGCILEPDEKRPLLDSLIALPNRGFVAANTKVGLRRRGFRVDGLLGFTSWPRLAREWRSAMLTYETLQDESQLVGFFNSRGGRNYRSVLSGEKPLELEALKQRREKGWKSGTVPAGAKVVVVQVDVQADRFECQAFGWGDGLEGWLIRRWSIDVLADGLTQISPFRHAEHWLSLLPLWSWEWPLADGSGRTVRPLTVTIDTGGGDSAGAFTLWHAARGAGIHPSRITLIKGGRNPHGKLMPPAQFAEQKAKGGARKNGPKLWLPNVHVIKNMIDARLRIERPGPGYIHLPRDLSDEHVAEMTAEQLEKGKWKKIRSRNETWDLLVYAYAAILRAPFAQSRTDMRWVPADYRVPDPEPLLNRTEAEADEQPAPPRPAPAVAVRRPPPPVQANWIDSATSGGWL